MRPQEPKENSRAKNNNKQTKRKEKLGEEQRVASAEMALALERNEQEGETVVSQRTWVNMPSKEVRHSSKSKDVGKKHAKQASWGCNDTKA